MHGGRRPVLRPVLGTSLMDDRSGRPQGRAREEGFGGRDREALHPSRYMHHQWLHRQWLEGRDAGQRAKLEALNAVIAAGARRRWP